MLVSIGFVLAVFVVTTVAQGDSFNAGQCGGSKRCLTVPSGCESSGDCQFMVSYSPFADGKSIVIELYGRRDSPRTEYVAMGFSTDNQMGNEPVAACVVPPNGQQPQLVYGFNHGKSHSPLLPVDPSEGQLLTSAVTETYIYCQFIQTITPVKNPQLPNLAVTYQVLLASGPTVNGVLQYHIHRTPTFTMTNFLATNNM